MVLRLIDSTHRNSHPQCNGEYAEPILIHVHIRHGGCDPGDADLIERYDDNLRGRRRAFNADDQAHHVLGYGDDAHFYCGR